MMDDESDYTASFVPRFLNEEPVVLAGLTQSEFATTIAAGFVSGLLLCVFIGVLVNPGQMFILIFVFGCLMGGAISAKFIRNIKVGKPRGYLSAKIKVNGSKYAPNLFNGSGMYLSDRKLTVGRSRRLLISHN